MSKKAFKKILGIFIVAFFGGFISLGGYFLFASEPQSGQVQNQKSNTDEKVSKFTDYQVKKVEMPSFNFSEVSKEVVPTVAHIKTSVKVGDRNRLPFFEGFPDMRRGSGSGVIISEDGYIVTNNHVVQKASKIKVTLHDKRSFKAEVVGRDESTDLAVIKIDAEGLKPIEFGNSKKLKIGEWVLAVGNPFNLTSTVTAGIVSAKARNLNLLGGGSHIESFIQTDAAVNPGNSGGALVNVEGRLVGINTAIASKTGQYAGYAFAVPASIVSKVAHDIRKYGEVKRGYLGVTIKEVDGKIAEEENLDKVRGAYVRKIMENSAADKANIKPDDVIISVDGETINNVPELQAVISQKYPGDKVKVTLKRDGEKIEKEVVLRNRQGDTKISKTEKAPDKLKEKIGADFKPLSKKMRKRLGINYGVKVQKVYGGKFKQLGIPEGFVILKINKEKVMKAADVYRILRQNKGGVLIQGVNPDGSKGYYGFGLK